MASRDDFPSSGRSSIFCTGSPAIRHGAGPPCKPGLPGGQRLQALYRIGLLPGGFCPPHYRCFLGTDLRRSGILDFRSGFSPQDGADDRRISEGCGDGGQDRGGSARTPEIRLSSPEEAYRTASSGGALPGPGFLRRHRSIRPKKQKLIFSYSRHVQRADGQAFIQCPLSKATHG